MATMTRTMTIEKTEAPTLDAEILEVPTPTEETTRTKRGEVKNAIRLLNENGELQTAMVSEDQKKRFTALTRNLNPSDINSVSNFGTDLQGSLNSFSSQYLSKVRTSKTGELGDRMTDLLVTINGVDIDGIKDSSFVSFLRKVPILSLFAPSIEKKLASYDNVQSNIKAIETKINATRLQAEKDNNALEVMFDENVVTLKRLEETIVAGKYKLEELKKELSNMENNRENYDDYQIQDMQEYINRLDKRLGDLLSQYYATKISLPQIRAVQYNNTAVADNARTLISITVPTWRSQLAYAVALNNQKNSITIHKAVRESLNDMLKKNADLLYENTVNTAKEAQTSVVDIDTFKYTTAKLIKTIQDQKAIQAEGIELRRVAEQELLNLGHELTESMTQLTAEASQRLLN